MTSFPICPSAAPPWAARRVIASAAVGPDLIADVRRAVGDRPV